MLIMSKKLMLKVKVTNANFKNKVCFYQSLKPFDRSRIANSSTKFIIEDDSSTLKDFLTYEGEIVYFYCKSGMDHYIYEFKAITDAAMVSSIERTINIELVKVNSI